LAESNWNAQRKIKAGALKIDGAVHKELSPLQISLEIQR